MSLVPDYGDSSSSNSSDTDSESENDNAPLQETAKKLPAPNFGQQNAPTEMQEASKHSVFTNPYIEAENAKTAILQKHVKMVDTKDNVIIINGKKICWNYRKGKCRFGHNCKYAHDSDIQKTQLQIQEEKTNALVCPDAVVCESGINKQEEAKQKRKRPGLSQGLVPGKKVMKQYMNQKT